MNPRTSPQHATAPHHTTAAPQHIAIPHRIAAPQDIAAPQQTTAPAQHRTATVRERPLATVHHHPITARSPRNPFQP